MRSFKTSERILMRNGIGDTMVSATLHTKSTSRQRSGKGAIRKIFPTPKTEVGKKTKLTIRYLYNENIS